MSFKDLYGRDLKVGDLCLRIKSGGGKWASRPQVKIVEILEFRNVTIKIEDKVYVNPNKLIKLSDEGLIYNRVGVYTLL
jgi:hypothetical protein